MPKYLFSNDQRISELVERIQWVADYVMSGKNLKNIPGKSDNNNAATLEFYYNLYQNTETTKVAITNPKEVVRNFVLKFQFPNPRTQESFNDSLNEGVFLAPYRMVISILVTLAKIEKRSCSYLTLEEILYYVFADANVCKNPSVDCDRLVFQILIDRQIHNDLSPFIIKNLRWNQYDRQIREMMSVLGKCSDSFQLSKGILKYTHNISDDDFITRILKYNYFWIPSNKENFDLSTQEYISYMNIADTPYNVVEFNKEKTDKIKTNLEIYPLQQIYYGAPGTGKSFDVNNITKGYSTIRTTFHPDSDYSTFVGAYKPTMEETPVYGAQGVEVAKEKRITYTYIKQAFLKAYLGAWQKYAKGGETTEPQFLVIEEINRGNCAQIFGDIFQLLDRGENGFSTYPIEADSDLQSEIKAAFADGGEYALENELAVDSVVDEYTSNYGESLSADIKNGRVLLLPNNLYIWATMNTSDQSLFPIDSAFKRRWDWRYVKIADAGKRWKIKCGNECCDWWKFVEEINKRIAKETSSDDKKLGYFFCKPPKDSNVIDEDKFVGKVLFYLWNDVFKDGDISLFKVSDDENAEICFDAFYNNDNNVNVKAIRFFLVGVVGEENIKTETVQDSEEEKNNDDGLMEDDDGNTKTSSNKNYDKFTINDGPEYGKNKLALECIRKYIELNPNVTAKDVYDIWSSLGIRVPHFIETKEEYDARKDNSKRSKAIECHGTTLYIACNGYGSNGRADELMNSVNEKEWGLTIKKVIK